MVTSRFDPVTVLFYLLTIINPDIINPDIIYQLLILTFIFGVDRVRLVLSTNGIINRNSGKIFRKVWGRFILGQSKEDGFRILVVFGYYFTSYTENRRYSWWYRNER